MSKTNVKPKVGPIFTHEGAKATRTSVENQLRRSVMSTFLWEDQFYESGEAISERIYRLVQELPASVAASIAVEARNVHNLRHAPLWILVAMIESKYESIEDRLLVGKTISQVVKRADEMGELISLYWKNGKKPLTKQMKIGLANAFKTFNEYQLAKYDGNSKAISIRDVMFLVHPRPDNEEQEALFKKVAAKKLATPDTWETQLSSGADKKETFERLMAERKLGALAFIRNLRNMSQSGVQRSAVDAYAFSVDVGKVLPFRFIAAAKAVPTWSDIVETMMLKGLARHDKLPGKTVIVVDNSGSMYYEKVSAKSDLQRSDAACALAVLIRGICEEQVVVSFSYDTAVIPTHARGLSLVDAIQKATAAGGTDIGKAVRHANEIGYDRVIVITDEQSATKVEAPIKGSRAYFINVASAKNGVGYGNGWEHIDGFSENVVEFIREIEKLSPQ